jgi:hypothetical protein
MALGVHSVRAPALEKDNDFKDRKRFDGGQHNDTANWPNAGRALRGIESADEGQRAEGRAGPERIESRGCRCRVLSRDLSKRGR